MRPRKRQRRCQRTHRSANNARAAASTAYDTDAIGKFEFGSHVARPGSGHFARCLGFHFDELDRISCGFCPRPPLRIRHLAPVEQGLVADAVFVAGGRRTQAALLKPPQPAGAFCLAESFSCSHPRASADSALPQRLADGERSGAYVRPSGLSTSKANSLTRGQRATPRLPARRRWPIARPVAPSRVAAAAGGRVLLPAAKCYHVVTSSGSRRSQPPPIPPRELATFFPCCPSCPSDAKFDTLSYLARCRQG